MSASNLRGPFASLMRTNLRLGFDQTRENATVIGAPPWTWPRDGLLIDGSHQALYAFVTGALADAWLSTWPGSSASRRGPAARVKGSS
jgi:hypothetical protein